MWTKGPWNFVRSWSWRDSFPGVFNFFVCPLVFGVAFFGLPRSSRGLVLLPRGLPFFLGMAGVEDGAGVVDGEEFALGASFFAS